MLLAVALLDLVKALVPSGLMMSAAVDMRRGYWTVILEHLDLITVVTARMLELPALHV